INTRFHNSINRAQPPFTVQLCPGTFCLSHRSGPRSICISLHGPQGPLAPISQKLSFLPNARTRSGLIVVNLVHSFSASISRGILSSVSPIKTVAQSRFGSIFQTPVKSFHAHSID